MAVRAVPLRPPVAVDLLKNARLFKHRLGDLYFHPDVLLAIVELNVATKNKFLKLYHDEERRIVDDAQKLMEHGGAIERNFGEKNPELVEEIARFREFKQRFDVSRADSNVKHDVVTQLKHSIGNILSQLDRGLGGDDLEASADLPASFFSEAYSGDSASLRRMYSDIATRMIDSRNGMRHPQALKSASAM